MKHWNVFGANWSMCHLTTWSFGARKNPSKAPGIQQPCLLTFWWNTQTKDPFLRPIRQEPPLRTASCDKRTINTGRHGPGGARNLTRETGTLDSLGSLLDLVLVAAAMSGDHLTRSCLHVHCGKRETGLSLSDSDKNYQSSARALKHEEIRNAWGRDQLISEWCFTLSW